MSLDDFLKGIAVFNQGLSQFAQSEATQDTQDQLAQINQQFGADPMNEERQAAVDQLSQNFALRLQRAGASPAEAGAAAGRIGLTELQNRQLAMQEQQLNAQFEINKIRALREGHDPFKVFNMRVQQEKFLRDTTENFENQTKNLRESINNADKAIAAINIGTTNAAASDAVGTMLAKALQPGNLTDREQAVFKGNRELVNVGTRLYRKYLAGEGFTEKDQIELMEYVLTLKQANIDSFDTLKKDFVSGNLESITGIGLSSDRLTKALDAYKFTSPAEELQTAISAEDQKLKALDPFMKRENWLKLDKTRRVKYEKAYNKAKAIKQLELRYLKTVQMGRQR